MLLIVQNYEHCYACLKITVLTSFTVVPVLFIHKNTVISNTSFLQKHFTNYTLFTNSNNLCFYTSIRRQFYFTDYVYYVTLLDELEEFNLQVLKSLSKILQLGIFQVPTFSGFFFCIQLIFLQKGNFFKLLFTSSHT